MEKQLEARGYASGAFMVIEGAFNSTSNITVKQVMIGHDMSEVFVNWTENIIMGRNLIVCHGDITILRQTRQRLPTVNTIITTFVVSHGK